MQALARTAMMDGAFGLSTGLFYVPGNYATTEEVIEIAKVVGPLGGMHISHMRDEAAGVLDSVRETIRIGEEGGLPTQITHHKIIGAGNWGRSAETLALQKRGAGYSKSGLTVSAKNEARPGNSDLAGRYVVIECGGVLDPRQQSTCETVALLCALRNVAFPEADGGKLRGHI